MTEATPKFKRILLKISGEALMGADAYGINRQTISEIVDEIKSVVDMGVQVGVVIGGGNIFAVLLPPPPAWIAPKRITWACWRP